MHIANSTTETNVRKNRRIGWLEVFLGITIIALVGQLSPNIIRTWQEWPSPGAQTPGHVVFTSNDGAMYETRYLLYLPQGYSSQKRWPLLLYLHGAGERGDNVERIRKYGPCHHVARGFGLPMIILAPQCPKDDWWESERLIALLDQIEGRLSVDPDRVYVGGFSMGGNGTWALASASPERFAAILPVAGDGSMHSGQNLTQLPIWAFHGANDKTVPVKGSTEIVEAIKKAGGKPKLTIFPKTGHGIGNQVFSRTDVYDWLLKQRRSKNL